VKQDAAGRRREYNEALHRVERSYVKRETR
jgi:hypothetical protein